MSDILDEFRRDDLRVLDRLVDGELSDGERRELLSGLDDEPGAWRRCALAFLEAQSFRGELGAFRSEPATVNDRSPHSPREGFITRSVMSTAGPWKFYLALAASLLVAFAFGLKLRDFSLRGTPGPSEMARDEDPPNDVPRIEEVPLQLANDQSGAAGSRWQTFKLGVGGEEAIEVPALEAANIDHNWLENQASAIPPDVLQMLEHSGHQVRQRKELWPIHLQDGRRLIVPVEQFELRYVGGSKFQ